ncbi:MAG: hypothetical protein Q9172_001373 [Xanthocarpia lactea]
MGSTAEVEELMLEYEVYVVVLTPVLNGPPVVPEGPVLIGPEVEEELVKGPVVPAETGSAVTVELGLVVDEPLEELAGGEVKV